MVKMLLSVQLSHVLLAPSSNIMLNWHDSDRLVETKKSHSIYLIYFIPKVNLFVHAYVMSNSISTLYELNQSLADLFVKSDFEELNLGPLLQQPLVYDMFKVPQDLADVPHVTTIQILKHLENYMGEGLWHTKVVLEEFMWYLSEKYFCRTPYDLGVRIKSIGLAISVCY